MSYIVFALLFFFFVVRMPIAFAMGLSASLVMFFVYNVPMTVVVQQMFTSNDSFPLLAVPFFMLAGALMESGGISRRLVNFASALVGFIHGGLAQVTIIASMFFAGISGAAAADTAAVGTLMIPEMEKRRYDKGFAAAIQAAAGSIGVIIPPSIPMVIYGVLASTSIGALFLGGIGVGLLVGISLMLLSYFISRRRGYSPDNSFSLSEVWTTFKEALWALGTPVIIVGGIMSGIFTATESAVVAADYSLLVGLFIYRELKLKNLPSIVAKAATTSAIVMFIIANASVFGWILAFEQIPQAITTSFVSITKDPVLLLLIINLLLLVIGTFIETASALIIFVPLLVPLIPHLGIDPVQFGVLIVLNLAIGMLTPPMGICLIVSCSIAGISLEKVSRAVMPFVIVMIVDLMIVSFVPFITTYIPGLFFR
ncbi:MAG: C4-dicarboxylate ABC transporter permease [Deltaproteobacteria bacterium CG_4_8_14_3_um_filter_51_11]|nr:TRAP transporter large permease [bacterium]OIP43718.1 MAG: C4-dicarboxylate ABC transporter permease [Desulfobacteraceae bacterium CG2_30_51_40]PIP48159.1 MAG: C4-dicarboxylate ABC transporter permease [Deltaproteobacteria bacterium CG23_combo_of_CG06-09_8_20_14_all_51_20]PIX19426.1 MAG: C4-dicarboxylate ABC transporter permease [Deltaproteobacteria bacterium CG_4_8_14_3_um_filter_51_11]PIY23329.1 MAG: C4-dicarboxylate ABC transporter permease [Deltaproteobacteria bacterium CG_4_10_14_3_um_f